MRKKKDSAFLKWTHLTRDIYKNLPNLAALPCPTCHQLGIKFQFVGDLETRIGYMAIWCSFCLHGIHIARVNIPEQAPALPFGISGEEISRRIPNFIHVKPD